MSAADGRRLFCEQTCPAEVSSLDPRGDNDVSQRRKIQIPCPMSIYAREMRVSLFAAAAAKWIGRRCGMYVNAFIVPRQVNARGYANVSIRRTLV